MHRDVCIDFYQCLTTIERDIYQVMVAAQESKRKGIAKEALQMLMSYAIQDLVRITSYSFSLFQNSTPHGCSTLSAHFAGCPLLSSKDWLLKRA